ncbi:MAG TPA: hypothetical protein V6C78_35070 [Crinalium sp.]|jgi:hypothetical protein
MAKLKRNIATALLVVIGVLTASPIITAFNPSGITALYGATLENNTALLLVRHRQILLGLLGTTLICEALFGSLRIMAIAINILSKSAFITFSLTTSTPMIELQRIVYFDVISIVLLITAAFIFFQPVFQSRRKLT